MSSTHEHTHTHTHTHTSLLNFLFGTLYQVFFLSSLICFLVFLLFNTCTPAKNLWFLVCFTELCMDLININPLACPWKHIPTSSGFIYMHTGYIYIWSVCPCIWKHSQIRLLHVAICNFSFFFFWWMWSDLMNYD
jgi:hypothetical protein